MSLLDIGFNFRATSGYVTDGANETYVLADAYPTTRAGVTFGWTSPPTDTRDRNSGVDRRLAGINYRLNNGSAIFRVDLPATGDYRIYAAIGDYGSQQGRQYAEFRDNTTTFATVDDANGTPIAHFDDIAGTTHSAANWIATGSGIYVTRKFASTILNVAIGHASSINATSIAHLRVRQMPATQPQPIWFM